MKENRIDQSSSSGCGAQPQWLDASHAGKPLLLLPLNQEEESPQETLLAG